MANTYAAKIDNGIVTQVIVGTSEWATRFLGGFWVDSEAKVGVEYTWSEESGFAPPVEPEASAE